MQILLTFQGTELACAIYLSVFLSVLSQHKEFSSGIRNDKIFSNSNDPNATISFAFIHAERLTMRMKNGLSSSLNYKPAEYEKLQAIMEAKRLESNLIGQKVNFSQDQSLKWQM